jgi:hypothetical protein
MAVLRCSISTSVNDMIDPKTGAIRIKETGTGDAL